MFTNDDMHYEERYIAESNDNLSILSILSILISTTSDPMVSWMFFILCGTMWNYILLRDLRSIMWSTWWMRSQDAQEKSMRLPLMKVRDYCRDRYFHEDLIGISRVSLDGILIGFAGDIINYLESTKMQCVFYGNSLRNINSQDSFQ